MAYQGAEALDLWYEQAQTAQPQWQEAPSFEVIEGGGLDARVRRGISPRLVAAVKACVALALAVALVGGIRIAVMAATVSQLREAVTLRTQNDELEDLNSSLEVERTIYSSNQRILGIATQVYGMVPASSAETVSLPVPAAEQGEGQATDLESDSASAASAPEGEQAAVAQAEVAGEDGR